MVKILNILIAVNDQFCERFSTTPSHIPLPILLLNSNNVYTLLLRINVEFYKTVANNYNSKIIEKGE